MQSGSDERDRAIRAIASLIRACDEIGSRVKESEQCRDVFTHVRESNVLAWTTLRMCSMNSQYLDKMAGLCMEAVDRTRERCEKHQDSRECKECAEACKEVSNSLRNIHRGK